MYEKAPALSRIMTKHELVPLEEIDSDMPPLVDNPNPCMSFTFATEPSPISCDEPIFSVSAAPPPPPTMFIMSPPSSPCLGPTRTNPRDKRKDSSHIPRPPNAFILFRSSFVKAQHIPDKIEGNHSSLSKIIGLYWKSLPDNERKVWEAKAAAALSEHRKKYPDWRFRPGNPPTKVKDGTKKRTSKRGRGEVEPEEKNRQKRCAKIASFLEEGITGQMLENAVREYDREAGPILKDETKLSATRRTRNSERQEKPRVKKEAENTRHNPGTTRPRCQTLSPQSSVQAPAAGAFKRSSSLPAQKRTHDIEPIFLDGSGNLVGAVASLSDFSFGENLYVSEPQVSSPVSSPASPADIGPDFNTFVYPKNMFGLPPLEPDVYDCDSPTAYNTEHDQTPTSTPTALPEDSWAFNPCNPPVNPAEHQLPNLSNYSSLTGWAGDAMYDTCLPNYPTPVFADLNTNFHTSNLDWSQTRYQPFVVGA